MAALPLSHHDIVELVQPFAERGRHVDLAASNRLERRLVFKPVVDGGDLHETLQLDGGASGRWRLTRTLREPGGLQATLQATGARPGELLARVERIDPARHFSSGAGYRIARDYELDASTGDLVLTRALLQLDEGLQLALQVPAARRMSANVELSATLGEGLSGLPEDLLAVLGWNWSRLERGRLGWTGKLRVRGSADRRTAQAEAALDRAARHLAQTLAEPPARFHERLRLARYGVMFRRAIPALMAVSLIVSVSQLPRLKFDMGERPGLWMLLYHLPTALIALSFALQDLARLEIPPLPRRSDAARWWSR